MEAVILAGGFATRLYPLTLNTAKPLLPVAGRPAIEHIFDRLWPLGEQGLKRIVVVVNERFAGDFERTLTGPYPVPVEIVSNGVVSLDQKLGAIGDMAVGARLVAPGESFWVLAGDNLFDFDLARALAAWKSGSLVMLYRTASCEQTREFNNLELAPDGRILELYEKPANPTSCLFATCIYLFPAAVRERLEEYLQTGNDPDKAGFFVRWLAQREPVYSMEMDGHWFDIGSVEILRQAEACFAR